MTCDELKAAINDEIAQNARIAAIRSRIDAGDADFLDSELYTAITAEITAKQMQRNVLALSDREPAFVGVVRERYTDTFNVFNAVQRILDAVTGIRIRTVQPGFENDRAHKIGHSLNDPTVPESVIERRAYSATENFVRSQHDRCTQANASFRSRAGLDCRITRTGGAKCCDWCASVSGSFTTSSAPDGIWGRHDNCKCSITYETRRGSFQQLSGTGKGWDTVEELPDNPLHVLDGETVGAGEVRTVSAEEAVQLSKKNELHVLTNENERVRIDYARIIDSMFYADDYEHQTYTKEEIIEHLKTSPVGLMAIDYLESNPQVKVKLSEDAEETNRGQHDRNLLTVWLCNCPNVRVAAQTVVHEVVHHKYDIGGSQLAETICFAFEKMHKEGRDYVTQEEWEILVEQVKNAYSDYPIGGGVGDIKRFDSVIKKG